MFGICPSILQFLSFYFQMLAIDTHLILGGGRNKLSPEEYIVAALDLYLDIVYLFMILLCLFGGGGGGD